jgi:hypothetical protein
MWAAGLGLGRPTGWRVPSLRPDWDLLRDVREPVLEDTDEDGVDPVEHRRLAVKHQGSGRLESVASGAGILDRDDRVVVSVADRDGQPAPVGQVELEARDGWDEAA